MTKEKVDVARLMQELEAIRAERNALAQKLAAKASGKNQIFWKGHPISGVIRNLTLWGLDPTAINVLVVRKLGLDCNPGLILVQRGKAMKHKESPTHKDAAGPVELTADQEAEQEAEQPPSDFLSRHIAGYWGEVSEEDKRLNDLALVDGSRLLSAYRTTKGTKIWIITEAIDDDGKRAATTLLLPDEY